MRVGLVADTFSVEKGTGIARYSREMLSGLVRAGSDVEPIAPEPPHLPFGMAINHAVKMPYLVQRTAGHLDLIHATSPITALAFPVVSRPKVVTYHDLLSLLCKNTSAAPHTRLFAPLFLRIGRYADRIIANSTQTKEELVAHLGIAAGKITVTPWGISEIFKPRWEDKRAGCVIGYVGALNRRKGLPRLIRAIHILKRRHTQLPVKLVICGRKNQEYTGLARLIDRLRLSQFVDFIDSPTDVELLEAYNSFDVFILPSEWEGFGLPILEAQRCGVPVIIREEAHIPQEVSKCCLRARSEEDMADKIYEILTNTGLRQAVVEEGLEYSQQFTWERTVTETLKVYEDVLN